MVPEINLLSPSERKRSQKILLLLGGASVVLLILVIIFYLFSLKNEISTLGKQEEEISAYRDALVLQASSEGMQVEGTYETAVDFVESISFPVTPLLKEVMKQVGNAELVGFDFSNTGLVITAEMTSLGVSSDLLVKLVGSDYFQDVKVEEATLVQEEGAAPFYSVRYSLTLDQAFLNAGGGSRE